MSSTNILGLLGGLALFLYGMQMMSNGLESVAGNKMKDILEKLTSNRFLGIIVGALITAVIQSSSATTVMVVGFVNSGMMTLNQAVWIIMGANIGTTITGQLIALDVGALAPLIAFIGVAIVVFSKNEKVQFLPKVASNKKQQNGTCNTNNEIADKMLDFFLAISSNCKWNQQKKTVKKEE